MMSLSIRIERDMLGEKEILSNAYYGIQTQRAIENFKITDIPVAKYPKMIQALGYVKKAAAMTNMSLGLLPKDIGTAIVEACDAVIAGDLNDSFQVDVIQGGAGTSTNMNANEVIANKALEILGHRKGNYEIVHPIKHVNCSQSTNDVYPTALRIGLLLTIPELIEAMKSLATSFERKAEAFKDIVKIGRTQLQDAVPMTLGQEFKAFATTILEDVERLNEVRPLLYEINLGATAIGTGINAPYEYAREVIGRLAQLTQLPLKRSKDLIEATWDMGAYMQLSGMLRRFAVKLSKICNDLRLLSSGPRAGFNEINLPKMQLGSSIIPGKFNPVIPEVVNQIAFQTIGMDLSITLASEAAQLQLNAMIPVIAFNLFTMLEMLRRGCRVLEKRCVQGITANREHCRKQVLDSIGIVTALNSIIGYEESWRIANQALESGRSIYEVALDGGIDQGKLERTLSLENLIKAYP